MVAADMLRLFKLVSLAALGTSLFLYYYTALCWWKWPDSETRFLLLADPQMEGDAKIQRLGKRGELDLFINDNYFRHIFTSFVSPYALFQPRPTHVVLLGDFFSSEWVLDPEFEKRVNRFKWIFEGKYSHRIYNVSGNHDIGYAGHIVKHRLNRWRHAFGELNFHERIQSHSGGSSGETIGHQIVVINSQNMDGPAFDESLRAQTWKFLNKFADQRAKENYRTPLILFTHIPTHKEAGICPDAPSVVYNRDGTIHEQNHLSTNSSAFVLAKLRPRYMFVGHDHRGCDVTHVVQIPKGRDSEPHITTFRTSTFETQKAKLDTANAVRAIRGAAFGEVTLVIREVTVASMMAEFGGNAGLFEIRRRPHDAHNKAASSNGDADFEYHYSSCPFTTHKVSNSVIVVDAVLLLGWIVIWLHSAIGGARSRWKLMVRGGVPAPLPSKVVPSAKAANDKEAPSK